MKATGTLPVDPLQAMFALSDPGAVAAKFRAFGRMDQAGEAARTLATGLANRTFPFIRYDLGDQVSWLPGNCSCGSQFARVADIGGRRDDDFHYPAATVPASA